jgi:signal transduction histidine kinase
VATSVFRIFQETLTNIARHAKAANVRIRLGIEDTVMLLEIHDDGKGLPTQRVSGKESLGLIGIRERVHQLGGKVTFKGVRNKGTTVTVTIPLNKGVPDV